MNTFLKPLSTKDEKIYLNKMKMGDLKARNILIEHNMRLVAHIVKKYNIKENDMEDLISIGTIGLIKAIDTFSVDKNYKLATYAARCIENEILMEFRNGKKTSKEIFMYEAVGTDNTGNTMNLIDVIEADDEDIIGKMDIREKIQQLYIYIEEILTDREKEIIYLRYGLNSGKEFTQREISGRYGISRSYVSRIEKKALKKLYKKFTI
ncbi:MAG: sigma-70 family RNA polymerase sigma factor [Lachnospiraceae bacterium]|nr:sigma-70 family RNA polymerase sigma factor [Lachnospiraceae bacterium]